MEKAKKKISKKKRTKGYCPKMSPLDDKPIVE